jgi:hypothetical protein
VWVVKGGRQKRLDSNNNFNQTLKLVVEHQLVSHYHDIHIVIMKASGVLLKRQYVCTSCRRSLAIANRRTFTTTSPKKPDLYDIVAVGGGPVGLALLAALSMSTDPTPRAMC